MSIVVAKELPASFPAHMTQTSVGRKVLMAVTGAIAVGFVTGHMVGNLQVYLGPDRINHYAEVLHAMGPLLWVIRAVVALSFLVHIWYGIRLKLENWAARPESYKCQSTVQASLSSRTMIWTGLVIGFFVVYHLLHYTVRVTNPEYLALADSTGRFDVYTMVIMGFSNTLVSVVYLIAVALLAYHLSHAAASMFQTMGLHTSVWHKRLEILAWAYAVFLFVGYAAVPIGVMAGWLTLSQGGM